MSDELNRFTDDYEDDVFNTPQENYEDDNKPVEAKVEKEEDGENSKKAARSKRPNRNTQKKPRTTKKTTKKEDNE